MPYDGAPPPQLPFDAINSALLSRYPSILHIWFPQGRVCGNEFVLGDISGGAGESLSINMRTGVWNDFAAGSTCGHDPLGLYAAAFHNGNLVEAAKRAMVEFGITAAAAERPAPPKEDVWEPGIAPEGEPEAMFRGWDAVFRYRDSAGRIAGYVLRKNNPDGSRRKITPLNYGRLNGKPGWYYRQPAQPRPLYRLDDLARRPDAPVLVCEGEKAADAAAALFPQFVCITWPNGSSNVARADWSPLEGRNIVIWPDADLPGYAAAREISERFPSAAILDVIDDPAGADAADLNVPDPQGWLAQRTAGPDHAARVISAAIAGGLPIRGPLPDRAWIAAHAEAAPDVAPPSSAPAAPTPAGPLGPEPPPARRAAAPAAKPRSAPAPDRGLGWIADCQQTSSGDPVPNLANVALALRRDANLADLVAYDQMAGTVMLRRSVPARAVDGSPEPMPRPLRDADVVAVQEYLQLAGMARLAVATVHDAITLRAREAAYHPVQDYLTALRHDGTPRIDGWLTRYLGAESSPYSAGIGRMFLVSMVARIMRPGCKCDYMMVLEGPQGARKSTACRILGGQWFGDSLPDVRDGKAAAEYLAGMWLVEVAELSAISRAEDAALKAFLTRNVERYRPSYGRLPVVQPRQCVFIGTTNKDSYLRDETGGRRFWPVKVGHLDTDALAADRDQLFAEAVAAWRSGGQAGQWWPSGEWERIHAAPQQAARYEADAWTQAIAGWLADQQSATVGAIASHALGIETGRLGPVEQRRISASLGRLGWTRRHTKSGNIWTPPAAAR